MLGPLLMMGASGGGGPVTFSDNFARANGSLGANWTTVTGNSQIVSGEVVATSTATSGDSLWATAPATTKHYSQAYVRTDSFQSTGVWVRFSSSSSRDGYVALLVNNTSFILYRATAGVFTSLGSASPSGTTPYLIRLRVSNNESGWPVLLLEQFHSGSWVSKVSVTDTGITKNTLGIGINVNDADNPGSAVLDDWEGGDWV